jgi:hypothetical protein
MKMVTTRRNGFLQGTLLTLLVLGLILGVTGWFAARTQGFRDLAARRLSERLGFPVAIAESYIGWPYVLVLRGLESSEEGPVSLQIRSLRLGRCLRYGTLDVRGARISLSPDVTGDVKLALSGELVRLAGLRDAEPLEIMQATAHLQSRWRLKFDEIDLYWLAEDGDVDAYVRKLHFMMAPVRLPSGWLTYYRLTYPGSAQRIMGPMRDLEWEWLTRGGDDLIWLTPKGVVMPVLPLE